MESMRGSGCMHICGDLTISQPNEDAFNTHDAAKNGILGTTWLIVLAVDNMCQSPLGRSFCLSPASPFWSALKRNKIASSLFDCLNPVRIFSLYLALRRVFNH